MIPTPLPSLPHIKDNIATHFTNTHVWHGLTGFAEVNKQGGWFLLSAKCYDDRGSNYCGEITILFNPRSKKDKHTKCIIHHKKWGRFDGAIEYYPAPTHIEMFGLYLDTTTQIGPHRWFNGGHTTLYALKDTKIVALAKYVN